MTILIGLLVGLGLAVIGVGIYDLFQRKHAILRNFPLIGHFRYWIEALGPELRQYIVTGNDEERPFTRDQRRFVYASAKKQNNYFGFGSDNRFDTATNYPILKQATFAYPSHLPGEPGYDPTYPLPVAKILGAPRQRRHAFRPPSVVNISAMSFGSLSGPAVEALNRGAHICGCLHNTGEGGISPHHLHGGDLIWQLGTGYFGARNDQGRFDLDCFREQIEAHPVRAVEVKLSQGAKPGRGGILPGAKVTAEIAAIRRIPQGKSCISPAAHTEFHDADSLLDFVESLADATGRPIGIKSAVGDLEFWKDLAGLMETGNRGVDFIAIDGGEGGTGAAPLAFSDHVSLPFRLGMGRVFPIFAERGLDRKILFMGAGKLGFAENALVAFTLGCDMINIAREAMLAVGCIQAQRCHTGHCPTGVATQNKWLMRGLDPTDKAARFANYVVTLRHEILSLAHAAGHPHPAFLHFDQMDIVDAGNSARTLGEVFKYREDWGLPSAEDLAKVREIMDQGPTHQSS
ncbi:MAG: FMN-binding glutamate synthase family protein [Deltaproteobacteria bacterium]|nr:FMN-binding glutamate synthase family protein [Deltaproteobacteria bacterium]